MSVVSTYFHRTCTGIIIFGDRVSAVIMSWNPNFAAYKQPVLTLKRSKLNVYNHSILQSQSFCSLFQCDTSALGGSPSSTLTCSTASSCSASPSSTLTTSGGAQPSPQPLSLPSLHCSSTNSPSGTLSSPVSSPCPASGTITRISHGPPAQSPTSTLESKDSGIIGESCCYVSVGNPGQDFRWSTLCEFCLCVPCILHLWIF